MLWQAQVQTWPFHCTTTRGPVATRQTRNHNEQSPTATGIDPKVDYVFKRLHGEEDNALLLVDLLNAILLFPSGRVVTGVTLLNPFVAKDFQEGKVPIHDIRARDDPGRQFLLEMQQYLEPDLTKRLLYYWAGSHAQQILKGDSYEMLHPTYGIYFLNESWFSDARYHHTFRLYDAENEVVFCKDLEIHLIELNKFDVAAEQVRTQMERWVYFFKHGAELDPDKLPATLDVPVIRQAMEVLMKISQSELERQRLMEWERIERDKISREYHQRVREEKFRAREEEIRAREEQARAREEEIRAREEQARAREEEIRAREEKLRAVDEERKAREEELRAAQERARIAQDLARAREEELRAAQEQAGLARQGGSAESSEISKRIGRIQLLQQLLKQPETSSADLGRLTETNLQQLEDSLKLQLSGRKAVNGSGPTDKT